jgi:hypothetical protein
MLQMMKPEDAHNISRLEHSQISTTAKDDQQMFNFDRRSIAHENNITVEMPSNLSAKNSGRTAYHFYKNSLSNMPSKGHAFKNANESINEESPLRNNGVGDVSSHEKLPNLQIKSSSKNRQ